MIKLIQKICVKKTHKSFCINIMSLSLQVYNYIFCFLERKYSIFRVLKTKRFIDFPFQLTMNWILKQFVIFFLITDKIQSLQNYLFNNDLLLKSFQEHEKKNFMMIKSDFIHPQRSLLWSKCEFYSIVECVFNTSN